MHSNNVSKCQVARKRVIGVTVGSASLDQPCRTLRPDCWQAGLSILASLDQPCRTCGCWIWRSPACAPAELLGFQPPPYHVLNGMNHQLDSGMATGKSEFGIALPMQIFAYRMFATSLDC